MSPQGRQDGPTPFLVDSVGFQNPLPRNPESTSKACAGLPHKSVLRRVCHAMGIDTPRAQQCGGRGTSEAAVCGGVDGVLTCRLNCLQSGGRPDWGHPTGALQQAI